MCVCVNIYLYVYKPPSWSRAGSPTWCVFYVLVVLLLILVWLLVLLGTSNTQRLLDLTLLRRPQHPEGHLPGVVRRRRFGACLFI